ncbi:MAG: hypothetical protein Q4C45_02925 [Oscillospiraceae bacterium]|nr:hypothetical protein [Oscillospiraceae bacterium]
MRRLWIIALLLMLTGCGTETVETPEETALTVETAGLADGRILRAETAVVPGRADGSYDLTVTVYEAADLSAPVQVIQDTVGWPTAAARWSDANFDGWPDLFYTTHTTVRNDYAAWWLWDTGAGRFEKSEALSGLAMFPDEESGRLTQWEEWTIQTYAYRIYGWQGDQLVCLREIKKNWAEEGSQSLACTVTDDPMGTAQVVWQSRCMAGTEEEPALDAELQRWMDYDHKG